MYRRFTVLLAFGCGLLLVSTSYSAQHQWEANRIIHSSITAHADAGALTRKKKHTDKMAKNPGEREFDLPFPIKRALA